MQAGAVFTTPSFFGFSDNDLFVYEPVVANSVSGVLPSLSRFWENYLPLVEYFVSCWGQLRAVPYFCETTCIFLYERGHKFRCGRMFLALLTYVFPVEHFPVSGHMGRRARFPAQSVAALQFSCAA